MALGMGWGDPVHRFVVVLSGLELGTIPLERLFGNFRALSLARCSFSVQLDIQSKVANTIIAAYPGFLEQTSKLILVTVALYG